ncbi:hypothetical protein VKT23_000102 [Stygiomarasmius scandens]|uniref:Uncharacterized protein n=1 Tax=Marasmiellus scandens TaxID=2682957 RepID=A0ABR1K5V5_9AGAR
MLTQFKKISVSDVLRSTSTSSPNFLRSAPSSSSNLLCTKFRPSSNSLAVQIVSSSSLHLFQINLHYPNGRPGTAEFTYTRGERIATAKALYEHITRIASNSVWVSSGLEEILNRVMQTIPIRVWAMGRIRLLRRFLEK